jgi:hypothetical protein
MALLRRSPGKRLQARKALRIVFDVWRMSMRHLIIMAIVLCGPAMAASAEPIRIVSGSVSVSFISSGLPDVFVTLSAPSFHFETISFGDDFRNSVGWDGIDPDRDTVDLSSGIGFDTFDHVGRFSFTTVPAPVSCASEPGSDEPVLTCHASSRFQFSGTLEGRDEDGGLLFHHDLVGGGRASGFWSSESPRLNSVGYSFDAAAPIPEPAALWLLGVGGVAAGARHLLGRAARSCRA